MSSRVSDILKAVSFPMVNDLGLLFRFLSHFSLLLAQLFRTVKVPDLD